jgi:hypothetical protein
VPEYLKKIHKISDEYFVIFFFGRGANSEATFSGWFCIFIAFDL